MDNSNKAYLKNLLIILLSVGLLLAADHRLSFSSEPSSRREIIVKFRPRSLVAGTAQDIFAARQRFSDFFAPSLDPLIKRYHVIGIKRISYDPQRTKRVPAGDLAGAFDYVYVFELKGTDPDLTVVSKTFAKDKNIQYAHPNSAPGAVIAKKHKPEKVILKKAQPQEAASKDIKAEKITQKKSKRVKASQEEREARLKRKQEEKEAREAAKRKTEEDQQAQRIKKQQKLEAKRAKQEEENDFRELIRSNKAAELKKKAETKKPSAEKLEANKAEAQRTITKRPAPSSRNSEKTITLELDPIRITPQKAKAVEAALDKAMATQASHQKIEPRVIPINKSKAKITKPQKNFAQQSKSANTIRPHKSQF